MTEKLINPEEFLKKLFEYKGDMSVAPRGTKAEHAARKAAKLEKKEKPKED